MEDTLKKIEAQMISRHLEIMMFKPYVKYKREEFRDIIEVLRNSSNNVSQSFGIVLDSLMDSEFSFSVNPENTGSIKGHNYLLENYPGRYAVLFMRKLSRLPTEMNDDDPAINEIVLWRIKKRKGE